MHDQALTTALHFLPSLLLASATPLLIAVFLLCVSVCLVLCGVYARAVARVSQPSFPLISRHASPSRCSPCQLLQLIANRLSSVIIHTHGQSPFTRHLVRSGPFTRLTPIVSSLIQRQVYGAPIPPHAPFPFPFTVHYHLPSNYTNSRKKRQAKRSTWARPMSIQNEV